MGLLLVLALSLQDPSLEKLVERLTAERAPDREEAARSLQRIGRGAIPELRKAVGSQNWILSRRAEQLIAEILSVIPRLTDVRSAPLPLGGPYTLVASPGGKYLAISDGRRVLVRMTDTLTLVAILEARSESLGFDREDRTLTVVGKSLVRFETGSWKETHRSVLPRADCTLPTRAFVTARGSVFYRTRGGGLAKAEVAGEALRVEEIELGQDLHVDRVFGIGLSGTGVRFDPKRPGPAVSWGIQQAGIHWTQGHPLLVTEVEGGALVVDSHATALFDSGRRLRRRSVRSGGTRGSFPGNQWRQTFAAALDPVRAVLFTSEPSAFRAECVLQPGETASWNLPVGPFYQLTVDRTGRYLAAFSAVKVYRWKLADPE